MPNDALEESIRALRSELARLDGLDDPSRERLEAIVAGLERRLETAEGEEEEDHGLVEDVRDAIAHFEVEHPRATGILNDLMVTLGNMGI